MELKTNNDMIEINHQDGLFGTQTSHRIRKRRFDCLETNGDKGYGQGCTCRPKENGRPYAYTVRIFLQPPA